MTAADRNSQNRRHYSYTTYQDREYAKGFDQDRFGGPVGDFFHEIHEESLWAMIPSPEGLRILDLGAGTGRFSLPLAQRQAHVTAADASSAMLAVAQEKAAAADVQLDFAVADAHHLPFHDRSFDVVVSSRMLMHVVDWRQALKEMCRVTTHAVIVDFPPRSSVAGLAPALLPVRKLLKASTQVYRVFSVAAVAAELQRNGFFVEDEQRQLVLPFFFHRRLGNPRISRRIESFFRRAGLTRYIGAPSMIHAVRLD